MNELFKKEGHSIFTFKKGDIIIRLKSAMIKKPFYNDNLMITIFEPTNIDNSYRDPNEFIGVFNNLIYLKSLKYKTVHTLDLENWGEDWGLFDIPDGLTIEDCI
jgi:hypothetical protein